MARLGLRVRRLVNQVRGRHADLQEARLARMGYDDLVAEVIREALRSGYPGDAALLNCATAVSWLEQQAQATLAGLSEEKREDLLGRFPHLREPLSI